MNTLQACPRCAKRLPTHVRFCRRCGLALTPRHAPPPVPPAPPVLRPQAGARTADPGSRPAASSARPGRPRPGGLLVPALLAGLFSLAVVAVWFLCFSGAMDGFDTPNGRPAGMPSAAPVVTMPANPSYTPSTAQGPLASPVQTSPPFPPKPSWESAPMQPNWPRVGPGNAPTITVPQVPQVPHVVRPVTPHGPGRTNIGPGTPAPFDPYGFDGGTDRQERERQDRQGGRNGRNEW